MTIDWLKDKMLSYADREAFVSDAKTVSYGQLLGIAEDCADKLESMGISSGTVVSLETDYSVQAVAWLLSLIDKGAVVVPLSSVAPGQKDKFSDIANVRHRLMASNTSFIHEETGHPIQSELILQLTEAHRPGLILFSSGSTGESKAVLHDFTGLLDKFKVERHAYRTLVFLTLDHIGGLNTLFYTLAYGGTIIQAANRTPDAVCRAIEDHKGELLPTTPTFLNLLLISEAYKRYDLSTLKVISYGTEVMPRSTLLRLHKLFPGVRLLQTYGLSEIGIMRSKSREDGSLWVKIGGEGYETRIVDGMLHIRAASSMLGYLNAPNPFDEDGWFNTGDAVEVDGEYMRILGRKSELINVGGEKVYPAEIETVLLEMPIIRDATVCAEPNPLTGSIVKARVNLTEERNPIELKREIQLFCRDRLARYKIPAKVEIVDADQFSQRFKRMRREQAR